MDITKSEDFNKDDFPCKYDDCTGTQVKFIGSSLNGIKSAQFKCDKCNKYMKIVDGEMYFFDRYGGTNEDRSWRFTGIH